MGQVNKYGSSSQAWVELTSMGHFNKHGSRHKAGPGCVIFFYRGFHKAGLTNKNGVTKQEWGREMRNEEGSLGSVYCIFCLQNDVFVHEMGRRGSVRRDRLSLFLAAAPGSCLKHFRTRE